MRSYLNLLEKVYTEGLDRSDRTGTGTRSLFGEQLQIDLTRGFPLLTTKKVSFKNIVTELLWFLRGDTNIKYLHEHGCHIWDEWADENGDLGPVYGAQWRQCGRFRRYRPIDQISVLIDGLRNNPYSRRHIVSAWNVEDVSPDNVQADPRGITSKPRMDMALPPCHMTFQCYVSEGKLSLQMYQRSADLFLGVPYNIASYALLTHMLAQVTGLTPHKLIICFGDAHIYWNHFEQVRTQVQRKTRPLPSLLFGYLDPELKKVTHDQIHLIDYNPHPAIAAEVSV